MSPRARRNTRLGVVALTATALLAVLVVAAARGPEVPEDPDGTDEGATADPPALIAKAAPKKVEPAKPAAVEIAEALPVGAKASPPKPAPAPKAAPANPAPEPKPAPKPAPQDAPADPLETDELSTFQWDVELGRERAGFSGLPTVLIFVDETLDRAVLADCLASAEVLEEMAGFVGVLVSDADEAAQTRPLRRTRKLQVLVRAPSGKYLGSLRTGFACKDLVRVLRRARTGSVVRPVPSAIFTTLMRTPDPIEDLVSRGEVERARKYVRLLQEFVGEDHPAALDGAARLPRGGE